MPMPLLIGSCEPFSGKSALVLGLARQLSQRGIHLRFGKPLATILDPEAGTALLDADVQFIGATLGLSQEQLIPSLQQLAPATAEARLLAADLEAGQAFAAFQAQLQAAPATEQVLLEAAGSLSEGLLYGLSLPQLARSLGAAVVLVHLWHDSRSVDALLQARDLLGDHLAGVVLNAVDPEAVPSLEATVVPAL